MKKFKFKINGNQYNAEVVSIEDNIAEIEINGTKYRVEVDKDMQPVKTPKTASPDGPKGAGTIKSPRPGVVLDLFVKVGDNVKIGQRVLILEAMKMENNIEADKAGIVVSIGKNKGESVMEGDVLLTIG